MHEWAFDLFHACHLEVLYKKFISIWKRSCCCSSVWVSGLCRFTIIVFLHPSAIIWSWMPNLRIGCVLQQNHFMSSKLPEHICIVFTHFWCTLLLFRMKYWDRPLRQPGTSFGFVLLSTREKRYCLRFVFVACVLMVRAARCVISR